MNHLVSAGAGRWRLPTHARIVVYERGGDRGLLTVYDCGASHRSPTARLLGTLESVDAPATIEPNPTGRVVTLRGSATLERTGADRYRIAPGECDRTDAVENNR